MKRFILTSFLGWFEAPSSRTYFQEIREYIMKSVLKCTGSLAPICLFYIQINQKKVKQIVDRILERFLIVTVSF